MHKQLAAKDRFELMPPYCGHLLPPQASGLMISSISNNPFEYVYVLVSTTCLICRYVDNIDILFAKLQSNDLMRLFAEKLGWLVALQWQR